MIHELIEVLDQQLNLTPIEIAEILWLAQQQWQSEAQSASQLQPDDPEQLDASEQSVQTASDKPDTSLNISKQLPPVTNSPSPAQSHPEKPFLPSEDFLSESSKPPLAGLSTLQTESAELVSSRLIALPDAPGLRGALELLQALKPLLRQVPSAQADFLNETATAQHIAETRVWVPILEAELEPWLNLSLVVDATPSMLIWQSTIREVQRLLRQCGAFRDVRLWSLEITSAEHVHLRPGCGPEAARRAPYSPKTLIDPSGRRLIWVLSDCIDNRWQTGSVNSALQHWANQGPLALVQMLPEWLWSRTALQTIPKVRFYSSEPGMATQALNIRHGDWWQGSTKETDIKVPVLTLEPTVTKTWSEMVVAQGGNGAAGLLFPSKVQKEQPSYQRPEISPQKRVEIFNLFSSEKAKHLARVLSGCPEISLPIIRLVQATIVKDSDQVHVAEVLLGGLFKPNSQLSHFENPDQVNYAFHDPEIRRQLLQETHPKVTFKALSQWIEKRLGTSLKEFVAVLKNPDEKTELAGKVRPFAGITLEILLRQSRSYEPVAKAYLNQWLAKPERFGYDLNEWVTRLPYLVQDPSFVMKIQPVAEILIYLLRYSEDTSYIEAAKVLRTVIEGGVIPLPTKKIEQPDPPKLKLDAITFNLVTLEQDHTFSSPSITRQQRHSQHYLEDLGGGVLMSMVKIPGGSFRMGSPEGESGRNTREGPQRNVQVRSFFMGRFPVTQEQWRAVATMHPERQNLARSPSYFKGNDHRPVEQVNWYDAVEFCTRLSEQTGRIYRLPTEAEWEYACRAGTTNPFSFGYTILPELANYNSHAFSSKEYSTYNFNGTNPVDYFKISNAFGLSDMHGNVWEWCQDQMHENYINAPKDGSAWEDERKEIDRFRVLRGGSFYTLDKCCRSANRYHNNPGIVSPYFSFRVVCQE